jgi:mannose-6-phosphate isomerase
VDLLDGVVRGYAWGARDVIADLQGRQPAGGPEAELWLGAHPSAPSILKGSGRPLDDVIADDPVAMLGAGVTDRFGELPFLLKVLAAAEPLSIQAHPGLEQAREGFERETAAGVPLDSPRRTYRDANHKPELVCALTPFEAKCGFRPLPATRRLVAELVGPGRGERDRGVLELAARLAGDGRSETEVVRSVMGWLVGLDGSQRSDLVAGVVTAARALLEPPGAATGRGREAGREVWWTVELDRRYPGDIGVVVALLLNHVVLEPGQAVFLSAGNLHAYLEGTAVELMASSDNVVRGGLTPKHVDADELVAVLDATPGPAPVQTASGRSHTFDTPVPEFSLTRLDGAGEGDGTVPLDLRLEPVGPEIILVTEGELDLRPAAGGPPLVVGRGQAALVAAADGAYRLCSSGPAVAWRATVGDLGR